MSWAPVGVPAVLPWPTTCFVLQVSWPEPRCQSLGLGWYWTPQHCQSGYKTLNGTVQARQAQQTWKNSFHIPRYNYIYNIYIYTSILVHILGRFGLLFRHVLPTGLRDSHRSHSWAPASDPLRGGLAPLPPSPPCQDAPGSTSCSLWKSTWPWPGGVMEKSTN